jgi:branched-chain amino acid aminotransferase
VTEQFPGGDGIFETIKTVKGIPFAMKRHIARASRSALILGMRIPTEEQIRRAVAVLLSKSPETLEFGRLRLTFQRTGEFDLVHETYHPWINPARLAILDHLINENSPTTGIKTLPFTEHIQCQKEAHEAGFDDGIRFNFNGDVSETAVANLVLKIGDRWVTPNLASGCLPGITRGLALEWLDIEETILSRDDLADVEAMYLLSSLKNLQPVSVLEDGSLEIDEDLGREFVLRMAQDIDP